MVFGEGNPCGVSLIRSVIRCNVVMINGRCNVRNVVMIDRRCNVVVIDRRCNTASVVIIVMSVVNIVGFAVVILASVGQWWRSSCCRVFAFFGWCCFALVFVVSGLGFWFWFRFGFWLRLRFSLGLRFGFGWCWRRSVD